MKNILVVEDDINLSRGIVLTLKEEDRSFEEVDSIRAAKEKMREVDYDLLILDINLPDGSGLDLCSHIRMTSTVPILFLTANDTELDMVMGLEIGGDDYISKPFSLAVLRARVSALLRRGRLEKNTSSYKNDDFDFDFERMLFLKNGEGIELSKTEQKLLYALILNKGLILTREKLSESIWQDGLDYVDENALSVAISRLRAKLEEDPSKPKYIVTVFGIGYTWAVK